MEGKLIKDHDEYMLINHERFVIATTDTSMLEVKDKMKLSKQNCDEIFGVTDVEKLAKEGSYKAFSQTVWINGFKAGFNKAMELNKDKLFTLEDMKQALFDLADTMFNNCQNGISEDDCLKYQKIIFESLQQPIAIEVEIVKESIGRVKLGVGSQLEQMMPKLDSEGCLILKRI